MVYVPRNFILHTFSRKLEEFAPHLEHFRGTFADV